LAIKNLCGLSAAEIAKAFLTSEETIAKRIYRAKEKIRTESIELELPPPALLPARWTPCCIACTCFSTKATIHRMPIN
jgi:RNA polymerase sigma-70 factor (ECF subfamily)